MIGHPRDEWPLGKWAVARFKAGSSEVADRQHNMLRQGFSWLFSLVIHLGLIMLLAQTVHFAVPDVAEFMELELTEMEKAVKIVQPLPTLEPEPAMPEPVPDEAIPPEVMPLPMDETIVLDDPPPSPPAQVAKVEPESVSAQEPEVVELGPAKEPPKPKSIVLQPQPVPTEDGEKREKIVLRKDDIIAHRGHEARFGRSMMADYYSYSSSEFSGQFKVRDGRTISIIDARNTEYGRFLIYDSKHKTLRRMKESSKYVYTIGPSLQADEPVIGLVIFLAKNDRIERFILKTDDERLAHFPNKIHVREEAVDIFTNDGIRKGYMSLPPTGKNHRGVVLVHGDHCVPRGLILGFTRSLSAQGLASLSLMPRWCGQDAPPADSKEQLVADTRAALSHFGNLGQVDFRHVGLWGNGPGIDIAVRASTGGALSPAYMVCMVTDSTNPADLPDREELSRLSFPVLWLITGKKIDRWLPLKTMLESMREDNGSRFTIVFAPVNENGDATDSLVNENGWVDSITENHARVATSWIQRVDD